MANFNFPCFKDMKTETDRLSNFSNVCGYKMTEQDFKLRSNPN